MGKRAFEIKVDKAAFGLGVVVFLVALTVRLLGISWGLPGSHRTSSLHPDEPVVLMYSQAIEPTALKFTPGFYNYGTFYLTVLRVATDIVTVYSPVTDPKDPAQVTAQVAKAHVAGRVVSAVAGAATAWVVALLLLPFAGRVGAAAGGLACAFSPGFVVHSRFQTVDVLATFLAAASLLWLVRAVRTGAASPLRWWVYAGVLAGLSAGTKYTGMLLLVPMVVAGAMVYGRSLGSAVKPVGVAAAACLLAFVLATPGVLMESAAFMRDFKYEALHTSQGHALVFVGTSSGFVYHLSNLAEATSTLMMLIGLAGLGYLAYRREPWALVVVSFALVYYVLIGRAEVKFLRYVLPLVPVVALGFGAVVGWLHRQRGYVKYVNVFSIVALTGIGGGGLYDTLLYTQWMSGEDPRDQAGRVLIEKRGSVGIVEDAWFWSPTLFPEVAAPRAMRFEQRYEAQQRAPVPVMQVVDGANRPQWDTRLVDQLKPDRIAFSSFESDDLNRIVQMKPRPADEEPVVAAYDRFMRVLQRDYDLESVYGADGPKVHDLMYIRPTVWVWKRKTVSPSP